MQNAKFEKLNQLVLVDILAALPMKHVVKMASLGHENLQHTCSLKWVKDRMTHVTFRALLRAHRTGGEVATAFSTSSVMKRLKGRVAISSDDLENTEYTDSCLELAKKVSGKLYLCSKGRDRQVRYGTNSNIAEIRTSLNNLPKLTYVSHTFEKARYEFRHPSLIIERFPEIVFEHRYCSDERRHSVYYRPALLNGRHIVDVLRAVCGPGGNSEAVLPLFRREATERAKHLRWRGKEWEGVWVTGWEGGAVIALKC